MRKGKILYTNHKISDLDNVLICLSVVQLSEAKELS